MGKPQGDGLPEPTYYQREVEGVTVLRPAYVPADHVNLQAHGWRVADQQETAEEPAAAELEAERPAGSPRRERARVIPSSGPVGDEGGAVNG
jgi:hypothetical protein